VVGSYPGAQGRADGKKQDPDDRHSHHTIGEYNIKKRAVKWEGSGATAGGRRRKNYPPTNTVICEGPRLAQSIRG